MVAKVGKKNKARGKPSKLSVSDITELGGTQDDIALLEDIPDSGSGSEAESVDAEDFDADPIKKDDIRDFLKKLEIHKHRPDVAKDEDEDEADDNDAEKEDSPEPEPKKEKKKKKNQASEKEMKDDAEPQPSTSDAPQKKKGKNKYKVQHDEVSSTTKDISSELRAHMKACQKRKYLLVKAGEYFDNQQINAESAKLSDELVKQMETFAAKLLEDEITVYNKQRENTKRSDAQWMKTVLTSGTLADKIAALTVLIQESPLHSLPHIDALITMARKKNRRENIQSIDALKDLLLTDLIPGDRKLKAFSQRNLSVVGSSSSWNKDGMDKRLLMWYFESQLKLKYAEFIDVLKSMCNDTVQTTKHKAVNIIYTLLVEKPEQEKTLLCLLINKVGDPHYKLAATVAHLLSKLVEHHPNMKQVVVREVEQLLFRPNIAERAQYYSVCFLNQLKLDGEEQGLAEKLIHIYFSFFKGFVKKGEVDSKMMSGLLTGVNRSFPFAKLDAKVLNEQLDHLYKLVHIVNFNTSIQALMLLYQVMGASQTISERYYSALYRKLADPGLKASSKQAAFLNLLFKSLKKDESDRRVKAFVKRLLQICSYQQPQFICGALILLSEVLRVKPGLLTVSHSEEDSDEEEHFLDMPDPDDMVDTPTRVNAPPPGDEDPPQQNKDTPPKIPSQSRGRQAASWVHRANLNHKTEKVDYDPFHRNPQYCHAENECLWELENIATHFHPTVSLFAKQILKGEHIEYSGDPLQDFTLIRFLDRFVYKNPKKQEQIDQSSTNLSKHKSLPQGIKGMSVKSEEFVNLDEKNVPVDDLFLHRYFQQKAAKDSEKKAAAGEEDEDSDADSVTDAEFDNFLDDYEERLETGDLGELDVDFSSEFGKKRGDGDSDSESDLSDEEEVDDLEDSELAQAFKDEMANLDDEDDGDDFDDDDDEIGGDFASADDFQDQLDDDDELNDGEFDDDSDDEAGDVGFDEEDIQFSDDDDEFAEAMPKGKAQKRKAESAGKQPPKKKGKKSGDTSADIYEAAEEFGDMLDETAGSKLNMIGADAMSNKDKAHVKQLKWEADRDRWIRGGDKKHFSKKGRSGKPFNKGSGSGKTFNKGTGTGKPFNKPKNKQKFSSNKRSKGKQARRK